MSPKSMDRYDRIDAGDIVIGELISVVRIANKYGISTTYTGIVEKVGTSIYLSKVLRRKYREVDGTLTDVECFESLALQLRATECRIYRKAE